MSVRERHSRERRARRDAILAAAATVFAKHGLDGATIEMVARAAEIAVGTIYLYFASRDDLFLSLVAERELHLLERYESIQARALDPLAELRAIAGAYLDYVRESRELFIAQQSISWTKLEKRLRRAAERKHFEEVMALGHRIWERYEQTVRRAFEAGAIRNAMGPTKTAAVMWAAMNGAFMLIGDDSFFRNLTGLDPEHFIEETIESQIAPAPNAAPSRNGNGHAIAGTARISRARGREKTFGEPAVSSPA